MEIDDRAPEPPRERRDERAERQDVVAARREEGLADEVAQGRVVDGARELVEPSGEDAAREEHEAAVRQALDLERARPCAARQRRTGHVGARAVRRRPRDGGGCADAPGRGHELAGARRLVDELGGPRGPRRVVSEGEQLGAERAHRRPPLRGLGREGPQHDGVERGRKAAALGARRPRPARADALDELVECPRTEGRLTRQALVEGGAERELVRRGPGAGDAVRLLRRHVRHRAGDDFALGEGPALVQPVELGEAEVDHLRHDALLLVVAEEDVRRLDVAVHRPLAVGVRQRRGDGQQRGDRLLEREGPGTLELRPEIVPLEELHHEPGDAPLLPEIHHLEHVLVVQLRGDAPLPQEARRDLVVAHQVLVQHLHGHSLAQGHVPPFEDAGGRPLPHQEDQLVGPEARAFEHRASRGRAHDERLSPPGPAVASTEWLDRLVPSQ